MNNSNSLNLHLCNLQPNTVTFTIFVVVLLKKKIELFTMNKNVINNPRIRLNDMKERKKSNKLQIISFYCVNNL